MPSDSIERGPWWRWWVCGLLLLATTINYMDRQTLAQLKVDIEQYLALEKQTDYGMIEGAFGLAFAAGSICFGLLVDRYNVYWVYPLALIGWSIAGCLTGFAEGFWSLLTFRVTLGFFEGSNWPCALRTTQRILTPDKRSMGNGILQSGAALGAAAFPLVASALFDASRPETWRLPFFVVGAAGTVWVVFWWLTVRPADLALPTDAPAAGQPSALPPLPREAFVRRFAVLMVVVVTINMTWHFLRAWHVSFLRESHDFSREATYYFSMAYYVFTDVGVLTAGFLAMVLARDLLSVHASRLLVFFGMALLPLLALAVPFVSDARLLVVLLVVIGFGSLGVFACYYSFTQDLSTRSQGKVTGTLGAVCWVAMFFWQNAIGWMVRETGSYAGPFVIAGLAPMVAFLALYLFWGRAVATVAPEPVATALDEQVAAPKEAAAPAG